MGFFHTYIHTYTRVYVCMYVCVCVYIYIYIYTHRVFHDLRTLLQDVISLVFVIKKVHINMCPILDGYGVMTA